MKRVKVRSKSLLFILLIFCIQSKAQEYRITFGMVEEEGHPDTVIVKSYASGEEKVLSGSDTLILKVGEKESKIKDIRTTITSLRVYPNPLSDFTNIEFTNPAQGSVKVSIYNLSGKLIVNKVNTLPEGYHKYILSGINRGNYVISIRSKDYQESMVIISNSDNEGAPRLTLSSVEPRKVDELITASSKLKRVEEVASKNVMYYNPSEPVKFMASYRNVQAVAESFFISSHNHISFNFYHQDQSFWKTLSDCETGLIDVYKQFRNSNSIQLDAATNRADLSWPGYGRPTTTNQYYLQTFDNESNALNNQWLSLYKGIFKVNKVIEALEAIESNMTTGEMESWKMLIGEARFFRGLFYFWLHSGFNKGSVPIYSEAPKDSSYYNEKFQPENVVRDFFIADLEYAYNELPLSTQKTKEPETPFDPQFAARPTGAAAASILGKSYLYQKKYAGASTYLLDVINNSGHSLATVGKNITTDGELNSESLLEMVYDVKANDPDYNTLYGNMYANTISPVVAGGRRSFYPSCWLIMAYKNDSIDINDSRNTVIDSGGGSRNRTYSLRTSNSIVLVDDIDMDYYGANTCERAIFYNRETAYFRKLTNHDIYQSEKDGPPMVNTLSTSGVNYRVLRLTDIYLMYAECLISGGSTESGVSEALKYINKVRHRSALQLLGAPDEFLSANHDGKIYTATDVMSQLMYVERPLELCLEGYFDRQIDLRRWGITAQRFNDLSQEIYHLEHYLCPGDKMRWLSILDTGKHSGGNTSWELVDYDSAARNYNEDLHAWWPKPVMGFITGNTITEVYDPIERTVKVFTYDPKTGNETLVLDLPSDSVYNTSTWLPDSLNWTEINLRKGDSLKFVDMSLVGKPDSSTWYVRSFIDYMFQETYSDSSQVIKFDSIGSFYVYFTAYRGNSSQKSKLIPFFIRVSDNKVAGLAPTSKVNTITNNRETHNLEFRKMLCYYEQKFEANQFCCPKREASPGGNYPDYFFINFRTKT